MGHNVRDEGVGGSNPLTPTNHLARLRRFFAQALAQLKGLWPSNGFAAELIAQRQLQEAFDLARARAQAKAQAAAQLLSNSVPPPRYFYETGVKFFDVDGEDEDGGLISTVCDVSGFLLYDRTNTRQELAFCASRDIAEKIVAALNRVEAAK